MNKIFHYLLVFLLIPFLGCTQEEIPTTFTYEITRVEGDLNQDGIPDIAIVTQDTVQFDWPYLLEVFLTKSNGKTKLLVSSEKAIMPQYPNGKDGYVDYQGFDNIRIDSGELHIENQLLRGNFYHRFRFQNGQFELVRHRYHSSDGLGKIYSSDYNLVTGELIEYVESYLDDEVFKDSKTIVKLAILPSLSEFEPFEGENY